MALLLSSQIVVMPLMGIHTQPQNGPREGTAPPFICQSLQVPKGMQAIWPESHMEQLETVPTGSTERVG